MPKATLEFSLPEEQSEFEIAVAAVQFACAWEDIFNYLRNKLKYEKLSEQEIEIYEKIRDQLVNISHERSLPELP